MLPTAFGIAIMIAEAVSPATPAAPEAPAKSERLICRSFEVTGSLARRQRVCKTAKEWDEAARAAREMGERWQSDGLIAPRDPNGG